jgi:hypothetical protein
MLKLEEKQFAEQILTPEELQNIFEPKRDNPR